MAGAEVSVVFLTGGGVLEVRLARLAESVFDPTGGLAQLVQTVETLDISPMPHTRGTWLIFGDGRLGLQRQGDVTSFRAISPCSRRPLLFITVP